MITIAFATATTLAAITATTLVTNRARGVSSSCCGGGSSGGSFLEFEGFINYGSPIQSTSTNALGQQVVNVITPNVINQPIFATRKVTTNVTVFDGATVVLGGLVREDVQSVEDKTPILGDVPVVGRLFRSKVDQHIKRNLIIFVTAKLVNPAGDLVTSEDEVEEKVEALPMPDLPPPPLPALTGFGK